MRGQHLLLRNLVLVSKSNHHAHAELAIPPPVPFVLFPIPSFLLQGIMYMGLCPGGAEGTALAAIQTFASLAVMTSTNIGECLGEEDGQ